MIGILATVGVAMLFVGLYWLRSKLLRGSEQKRTRRQFVERERDRDRRACLSAAKSLDSGSAPREAFAIPGAAVRGPAGADGSQGLRDAVERRRLAATSTAFDQDLQVGG